MTQEFLTYNTKLKNKKIIKYKNILNNKVYTTQVHKFLAYLQQPG